jgi:uncharacterized membrane protein
MANLMLFLAAFLACAVEMVEALTIVLAVGVTRGWRSAGWGVGAAAAALTLIVVVFGPAITHLPIDLVRIVVGSVLLIFGLQWLRKAILRASGLKALHDEDAIYQAEVDELRAAPGHDWYAFTVAFKGVFLEGLEVAFLVVTFGGAQHNIPLAAAGALAALLVVVIAGAIAHAPLGVMLTAVGIFWTAEGAGADWPGHDLAILGVLVAVVISSLGIVATARRRTTLVATGGATP